MSTSLHSAPAQMGERIFHWLLDVVPDLVTLRCGDYGKSEVPGLMALNLDVLSNGRDMTMMVLNHMYKHPSGNLIQQGTVSSSQGKTRQCQPLRAVTVSLVVAMACPNAASLPLNSLYLTSSAFLRFAGSVTSFCR